MKLFECQNCGQPLYFENTQCENCGLELGYLPALSTVTALQPVNDGLHALAAPAGHYHRCANAQFDVCNWLVSTDDPDPFCLACRHNRTIPDLSQPKSLANWAKTEVAKHRLFYTLLKLHLPLKTREEDPDNGLAFDFLASSPPGAKTGTPVMTGHASGLITLNLDEADDAERERLRGQMHEPYRTLLGHFRHEIAHYYWDRLVKDSLHIEDFRQAFGDERQDYGAALKRHYDNGPPADWTARFVTSYASSHPWEDFAETWAHYFHMVDTLETAGAFGVKVRPKVAMGAELATVVDFDSHTASLERIIESWIPLTFAVNSINRSMGQQDLYPFVLSAPVIGKLSYIHDLIRRQQTDAGKELRAHPHNVAIA